jgi:SAM-dependent methyltransferase
MKGIQTETIIHNTKGFNGSVTVHSAMAVKNGTAWVEETKFEKFHYKWHTWLQREPDGQIVRKGEFLRIGMETTGACDECHQMPCVHTAFLLGWTSQEDYKTRLALQNWRTYWNQQVAESFGGEEMLKQNSKYVLEERPIIDLVPECGSILDAGCGVGRYTPFLRRKCRIYVGVDYSERMLEQARKYNSPADGATVSFVQGDLETMDLAEIRDEFEIGILIAVIRHLPYEKGLAVLKHVAGACGMLLFTASIIPEGQEIPMIVKGTGDNVIVDHPYHLSDLLKTLDVGSLDVVPIGDREPTAGKRYVFRYKKWKKAKA